MGGRTYMKYAKLSDFFDFPLSSFHTDFHYETHATSFAFSAFWGPFVPPPSTVDIILVQYVPETSFPAFTWEGG